MTHYAILDTNAGLLQWIGKARSEDEALEFFAREVGDEINRDSLVFYSLTEAEAKTVSAWWADGARSNETPDCIR